MPNGQNEKKKKKSGNVAMKTPVLERMRRYKSFDT